MSNSIMQGIVFALYIGIMLGVGFLFYKKSESHADYILGGRGMNKWVTAMSAQASDMSGWLLLGLPGLAYASSLGATEAIWTAIGLALGTYINWLIVAKKLRLYSEKTKSLTIPEFFQNRFHDKGVLLRVIPSLFILIFFLIYTASGFVSGAKLFNLVFNIPYSTALIISVLVIVIYTFLGGFKAVCWTDLIQGVMMFFAVIIIPVMMIFTLTKNGFTAGDMSELLKIPKGGETFGVISIIGALAWGLGYFGQPHILVRFMAIKSADEVKPARIIAMIWVVISLAAAVILGLLGRPYLMQFAEPLAQGAEETIFMVLVNKMLPPIIAAVLLSAILAAIMSTADSQLLVTASAISGDFYKAFINKNANDKQLVMVSRITVVAVAVVAGLLASDPNSSVFEIVSHAWAGFGAAFGPIMLCALFWKKTNANGAIAGIISGGVTALVWAYLPNILALFGFTGSLPTIFSLYEIVPGFIVSLIFIAVLSYATGTAPKEVEAEFESIATHS